MFLSSGLRMSLAGFHEQHADSGSFLADPEFRGTLEMERADAEVRPVFTPNRLVGKKDLDFPDLLATNPRLVERGIGLDPAAFEDFHFSVGN